MSETMAEFEVYTICMDRELRSIGWFLRFPCVRHRKERSAGRFHPALLSPAMQTESWCPLSTPKTAVLKVNHMRSETPRPHLTLSGLSTRWRAPLPSRLLGSSSCGTESFADPLPLFPSCLLVLPFFPCQGFGFCCWVRGARFGITTAIGLLVEF